MSEIAVQGGTPLSLNSQVLPFARRGISRAVALGWQVAQLFHSPVHQGPVTDPPRGSHLPGRHPRRDLHPALPPSSKPRPSRTSCPARPTGPAARDILSLSDYLAAGRRGAVEMTRRFWWVAAAASILTAGVIYAGSYLHGVPDLVRVAGSVPRWGNWRPIRTAPRSCSAVISSSARPNSPDHRIC